MNNEIPAAGMIEAALDMLNNEDYITPEDRVKQLKELEEAMGDTTESFQHGFELGLQTARFMAMTKPGVTS